MDATRHPRPGTLGREASNALKELLGDGRITQDFRDLVVERVLDMLNDPDAEMVAAGVEELRQALPGAERQYLRDLARVIWRAMLSRCDV